MIRHLSRILKIIYILARNDALFILKKFKILSIILLPFHLISSKNKNLSDGQKITNSLEELGPIFIKFGQALSTRSDIVGHEIAESLSRLQDSLPAFDFEQVKKAIFKEFEMKIEDVFAEFNEIPVAAASIAQVHRAKTFNGEDVAVKILRPEIEKQFESDLALMEWAAKKIDSKIKRLKPKEVVNLLAEIVKVEMDLRLEAAACSEIGEDFKDDKSVFIPEVKWDLTAKSVLTIDWVDGININEVDKLKEKGHDLEEISKKLAIFFFNQAYQNGFFHADLHPGNLMINDLGQIIVIDFGIMGRLENDTRIYVTQILHGFLARDYKKVAQIHFDAGYVQKDKSFGIFAQNLRAIGEPIIGQPVNKISIGKLLSSLFKLTEDFEMEVQPQLLLLQKTTILIEGIGAKLNPNVNMWKLAEPWIEKWAIENFGVEAKLKEISKKIIEKIITKS